MKTAKTLNDVWPGTLLRARDGRKYQVAWIDQGIFSLISLETLAELTCSRRWLETVLEVEVLA
ncbi:hypothetical protein [Leptolyngbya sp. FACHB-261]|uniref:hypothetical protein n=1 Tax=Leptolyngbya sp. FACHB-261 TaxID=2692806 RepID=UPI001685FCF2|nr:hypothetical protein [Leptolyngbya sp. FACHB-261]MBD2099362.1 hypothetical protein [Leptolyngbya sp. FACHB-261]